MLVLTRRLGEGIVIQGDIRIKILKIRGSQVQLGIEAPADVNVRREELDSSRAKPTIAAASA